MVQLPRQYQAGNRIIESRQSLHYTKVVDGLLQKFGARAAGWGGGAGCCSGNFLRCMLRFDGGRQAQDGRLQLTSKLVRALNTCLTPPNEEVLGLPVFDARHASMPRAC